MVELEESALGAALAIGTDERAPAGVPHPDGPPDARGHVA
jgi:hypothetical protein